MSIFCIYNLEKNQYYKCYTKNMHIHKVTNLKTALSKDVGP